MFDVLNPGMVNKKSFGFNTTTSPPPMKELEPVEKDIFALIRNIFKIPVNVKERCSKNP